MYMMMDWAKLTGQISSIKVKNVVESPLKYVLYILALAIFASIFSPLGWITIILMCFAGLLVLIAAFAYIYFSIKNPDYLRSEEYNLKKQSLEILGDKNNPLELDSTSFEEIVSNPYLIEET